MRDDAEVFRLVGVCRESVYSGPPHLHNAAHVGWTQAPPDVLVIGGDHLRITESGRDLSAAARRGSTVIAWERVRWGEATPGRASACWVSLMAFAPGRCRPSSRRRTQAALPLRGAEL